MSIAVPKDLMWIAARHANSDEEVLIATEDGRPADCTGGMTVTADIALADATDADVIMVGSFWGRADRLLERSKTTVTWLRDRHDDGALIAGIGTGTFLVAATGLLDGGIATTHRPYAPAFRQHFPHVDLQLARTITVWGQLWCSAGINAGFDMLVSIIDWQHGRDVARTIATEFLADFSRAYEVAAVSFVGQKQHHDQLILDTQTWIEHHADQTITITTLAQQAGLSPRQFTRRFHSATGETPASYLRRFRLETARELATNTSLTTTQIARRVGYTDPTAFHRAYNRHFHTTPRAKGRTQTEDP